MIMCYEFSDENPWSVRELAERFKMSVVPVYGALKRLEQEGLVTVLPHRGISVKRLTPMQIQEALVVREGLEIQAARMVAKRGSKEVLDTLREMTDKIVQYVKEDNFEDAVYADTKWHEFMVTSAGCGLLTDRFDQLTIICRLTGGPLLTPTAAVDQKSHLQLLEALESRDPDIAEKAIRDHLGSAAT